MSTIVAKCEGVDACHAAKSEDCTYLSKLLYLDTSIWNVLCEQAVDPRSFQAALRRRGALVVLGINAYVELAKSFFGKRPGRALPLIVCVSRFLEAGTPVADSWERWLIGESRIVSGKSRGFSLLLGEREQSNIASWTKGLLSEEPPDALRLRLIQRSEQTRKLREAATKAIGNQPDILDDLRQVSAEGLGAFLDQEGTRPRALELLARYLPQVFAANEESLPMAPERLARALLATTANRAAHAIVRVNIYGNWRATRSEEVSFAKCVPEDSYHVANASYCDAFVTADTDSQGEAAARGLRSVRTLVYRDRTVPLEEWLLNELSLQFREDSW